MSGKIICKITIISICFIVVNTDAPTAVNFEQQLRRELFSNRKLNPISRPGRYHNDTMNVEVTCNILYVHKLDPRRNILKLTSWLSLIWKNRDLSWNPKDYGEINSINVDPSSIWIPYMTLFNSVVKMNQNILHATHAVLRATGDITLVTPLTTESHCVIDIHHFPFDHHLCTLIFGSWTHDGTHINVSAVSSEITSYTDVPLSNDFQIIHMTGKQSTYRHTCCRETYSVAVFKLLFQRHSSIYQVGILLPSALVCILSAGLFWIKPLSGHRLKMGLVLLIANLVLLLSLGIFLPISSSSTPSIIIFCVHALCFTTLSLMLSMVSINLRAKHLNVSAPGCIQSLTDGWLARYCFIKTPIIYCGYMMQLTCGLSMCFDFRAPQDDHEASDKEANGWLTLVLIIDRFAFFIFSFSFLLLFILYLH